MPVDGVDASVWMQLIGLGAVLGALGQGIRAIVGLKKVQDAASTAGKSASDVIDPGRLLTSLLIGAIAGSLAAISLVGTDLNATNQLIISTAQITALIGAGYAGADFIEGFMNRVKGDPKSPAGSEVIGTGAPAPTLPAPATDDAVG
jgi:hypothetical protein